MQLKKSHSPVNILWAVATVITTSYFGNSCHAQSTAPSLSLTLKGPAATVKPGAACPVAITLTNVSNGPVTVRMSNDPALAYKDLDLTILDESSGLMLVPKKPAKGSGGPHSLQTFSYQFKTLQPGETAARALPICQLYDLSLTGVYQVSARWAAPQASGGRISANTVEIDIEQ